jgi:hypothetical protein
MGQPNFLKSRLIGNYTEHADNPFFGSDVQSRERNAILRLLGQPQCCEYADSNGETE